MSTIKTVKSGLFYFSVIVVSFILSFILGERASHIYCVLHAINVNKSLRDLSEDYGMGMVGLFTLVSVFITLIPLTVFFVIKIIRHSINKVRKIAILYLLSFVASYATAVAVSGAIVLWSPEKMFFFFLIFPAVLVVSCFFITKATLRL